MRCAFSVSALGIVLAGCVVSHPIHAPTGVRQDSELLYSEASARGGTAERSRRSLLNEHNVSWQAQGKSILGKPLNVATFGSGPRKVLFVGGIHGDEREGQVTTQRLPRAFQLTKELAQLVTLTIVEDLNPDGTGRRQRGNARGVDLNRNFPADNFDSSKAAFGNTPLSQPESKMLHDLILQLDPDLVIVAHSWRGDHFINFDGPAEGLARLFSVLSGYRVQPSSGIGQTPGSLGSWVGYTLGKPILTLEHERGADPHHAWDATRLALLAVIRGEAPTDPLPREAMPQGMQAVEASMHQSDVEAHRATSDFFNDGGR